MALALNEKQLDLLRALYRQGEVLVDHVDGRVARALRARGLAASRGEWLRLTDAGRAEFEAARRRGSTATGSRRKPGHARAEAITRATEALQLALPRDAEVRLGDVPVYGDDIVSALFALARRLARTADT